MSELPTYGRTSPEASVQTSNLGQPTGSARMAGPTSAAAPEPPAPTMPPRSLRCRTNATSASAIAATALPRSPVNTAPAPAG